MPDFMVGCGTATLSTTTIMGAQYRWFNASTGQTLNFSGPTATVSQSGRYGVRVSDPNGCVNSDTVTVEIIPTLSLNLGPDRSVCGGETLDAGNAYSGVQYRWVNVAQPDVVLSTARTLFVQQTGTYRATVFAPCNLTVQDEVTLTVYPEPTIDLGPDRPVCGTETLSMSSDIPGSVYRWYKTDAPGVVLSQQPNYVAQISGTYVGTIQTPFGCSRSDTVVLAITVPPSADLGPDVTACGSAVLDAGFGAYGVRYAWFRLPYLGDTLAKTKRLVVTQTGIYRVVVTTEGCIGAAFDDVSVFILPSPNRLPDWDSVRVLCNRKTLEFDIPPGHTALWSTGQTGSIVNFDSTGLYWLNLTGPNGCVRSDTFFIRLDSIEAIIEAERNICSAAVLSPQNLPVGAEVEWYDEQDNLLRSGASLTVENSGIYRARVRSQFGCLQELETRVTQARLTVSLGQPQVVVCEDLPVNLNPEVFNPGGLEVKYWWSNGDTTPSLSDVPTGLYTVRVYNAYCEAFDTVSVFKNETRLSNIQGNPRPRAGTQSVYSVEPRTGVTYRWTVAGGNIVSGQNTNVLTMEWSNADVGIPITLRVEATDAQGCTAEKSFVVTVQRSVSRTDETLRPNLIVYPNPAQNEAVVRVENVTGSVIVRLTDLNGKTIRERRLDGDAELRLDLSDLASGTYVVQSGT
ncbi:MAG: T9SS type A sorting domain-containing protein, partial [Bacteroidia bacterium]|nr:T9SS type A sorting domain-containing protein [Bacteroidia bacterium]